jgi:hypothetical protein
LSLGKAIKISNLKSLFLNTYFFDLELVIDTKKYYLI